MAENRESAQMRRVSRDWSSWDQDGRPAVGDFQIRDHVYVPAGKTEPVTVKQIAMVLPGGSLCIIPLRPVPPEAGVVNRGHSWTWDGNEDAPTLTPSVHHVGAWHGWIRAGRMESC
jgi:hypothetical protein